MNKISRWALVVVIAGFILYVGIYIYGSRSDAYRFSQTWLEQSESVKSAVGDNRHYRLSPWGGFSQRFAGDKTTVLLDIEVTGTKGAVTVRLELQKVGDVWTVVNSGIV